MDQQARQLNLNPNRTERCPPLLQESYVKQLSPSLASHLVLTGVTLG